MQQVPVQQVTTVKTIHHHGHSSSMVPIVPIVRPIVPIMGPRVVVAPRMGVGIVGVGGGFHSHRAVVRGPVVRT